MMGEPQGTELNDLCHTNQLMHYRIVFSFSFLVLPLGQVQFSYLAKQLLYFFR